MAKGQSIAQVCKKLAVAEQIHYRWRKEYGGLRMDQAKQLKELVAETELDKAILREAARPN